MKRILVSFLCVISVCASDVPRSQTMQEGHKTEALHNLAAGENSMTDVCCMGCVCCCFIPIFCACAVHEKYVKPVKTPITEMMCRLGIQADPKKHNA